jgi:integrase
VLDKTPHGTSEVPAWQILELRCDDRLVWEHIGKTEILCARPLVQDEISEAVGNVDMRAFAAISVAASAGLRLAELRGLRQSDYDGDSLRIDRADWRTNVNLPKTVSSPARVPVIPILKRILDEHRVRVNGQADQYIFAGERL